MTEEEEKEARRLMLMRGAQRAAVHDTIISLRVDWCLLLGAWFSYVMGWTAFAALLALAAIAATLYALTCLVALAMCQAHIQQRKKRYDAD